MVSPSQSAAFATTIETRVLLHGVPVALSMFVHIGHQDGILSRRPRTLLQIPRISENLLWQIHDPQYPPPPPPPPTTTTTRLCPVFCPSARVSMYVLLLCTALLQLLSITDNNTTHPILSFMRMKQSNAELLLLRT
jgi:hypothetical protein